MDLEEFGKKVEKMTGKKNRGFGIEVDFYTSNMGSYIGRLRIKNWKYEGLWAYGERNFNAETLTFKAKSDIFLMIFEENTLEKVLKEVYQEIRYIVNVYDMMTRKELYQKFEFSF